MNNQWKEYIKILSIIQKYYPKECKFNSKHYADSREYKKYKKVIKNTSMFCRKEKEYYDMVCSIFPQYYVKRWTNTSYPCFQYSVLLHKNQPILDDDIELMDVLGGKRYNLEIFISRISDYYYVYTSEHIYDKEQTENWMFNSHSATFILNKTHVKRLQKEMKKRGINKLSKKMAHIKVPFIETELLPVQEHEVEVFNCLFSDMVIDYY